MTRKAKVAFTAWVEVDGLMELYQSLAYLEESWEEILDERRAKRRYALLTLKRLKDVHPEVAQSYEDVEVEVKQVMAAHRGTQTMIARLRDALGEAIDEEW